MIEDYHRLLVIDNNRLLSEFISNSNQIALKLEISKNSADGWPKNGREDEK